MISTDIYNVHCVNTYVYACTCIQSGAYEIGYIFTKTQPFSETRTAYKSGHPVQDNSSMCFSTIHKHGLFCPNIRGGAPVITDLDISPYTAGGVGTEEAEDLWRHWICDIHK